MGCSGDYCMHSRKRHGIWIRRSEERDYLEDADAHWRIYEKLISK
jgi:hypothetical protein